MKLDDLIYLSILRFFDSSPKENIPDDVIDILNIIGAKGLIILGRSFEEEKFS